MAYYLPTQNGNSYTSSSFSLNHMILITYNTITLQDI